MGNPTGETLSPVQVDINQVKNDINLAEEAVIFKRYPGHTAEEIAFYAPKPLSTIQPDQVVIVAGTNSLRQQFHQNGTIDEYEVVDGVLDIARAAREHGVKKIHVSSVLVRRGYQYRGIMKKVNDLLYMACIAEDFIFMNQDDITLAHIEDDGVHPNYLGSTILKYNILSVFRTFDRNQMDFRDDYVRALH